jgi:hypothetical protein
MPRPLDLGAREKNITKLINFLTELLGNERFCPKAACTTCGGGHLALRKMTDTQRHGLESLVKSMTFDEFRSLGDWATVLSGYPRGIIQYYYDIERNKVIESDPETVDQFLIDGRSWFRNRADYKTFLTEALESVCADTSPSLIETLVVILREGVRDNERLLSIALAKMNEHEGLHRALYNFCREQIPEVRSFKGDGSSVVYW